MFTTIPTSDAFSVEQRSALAELRTAALAELRAALEASPDAETFAAIKSQRTEVARLSEWLDANPEPAAEPTEDELAAEAASLDEFMRSDEVKPMSDPKAKKDASDDKPAKKEAASKKDAADDPDETFTPVAPGSAGDDEEIDTEPVVRRQHFVSTANATDVKVGHTFTDMTELAASLTQAADSLGANPVGKYSVAQMKAAFSDGAKHIDGDDAANFARFTDTELMAALCAPATPLYDLACESSLARPVKANLPTREAPRGKLAVYPSPTLSDITNGAGDPDGYGIWTSADDDNVNSVKGFAEITCGTPVNYEIYGVYKHLRAPELLLRTFPELIAAYLNKLGALHSRTGEVQLLNSMASGTIALTDSDPSGYGATVSILRRLLTLLSFHRDQERWDDAGTMDVYLPRWTLTGMCIDLMSRNTNGVNMLAAIPTEAQIRTAFSNAGFNLIPFLDDASWSIANSPVAVPAGPANAGDLSALPTTAKMIVTPPGKFAVMDRGDFSVGVAGAPMHDSETIKVNKPVFFYENFEGLVNLDTCPAYTVETTALKFTGQQVADITLDSLGADPV